MAIPIAIGIAFWGYRAYQGYRAVRGAQMAVAAATAASRARQAAQLAQAAKAAQTLAQAQAAQQPCQNCGPGPKCEDLAGDVKAGLYRNKRALGGGSHGYLNRMVEQMCGQNGPGTKSWTDHISQLRGERNRIADAMQKMKQNGCNPQDHFSREERLSIDRITNGSNGWSPETIPWKGPNHADCLNVSDAVQAGRLDQYLSVIRP